MKNRLIRSRNVRTHVDPGDGQRLHAGTSVRRARARPIAPVTRPIATRTTTDGRISPGRRPGPAIVSIARRNQACGVMSAIRAEDLGRLAERDEDAADGRQAEGDDGVEPAGLLHGLGQGRHEGRDAGRGEDRRER